MSPTKIWRRNLCTYIHLPIHNTYHTSPILLHRTINVFDTYIQQYIIKYNCIYTPYVSWMPNAYMII